MKYRPTWLRYCNKAAKVIAVLLVIYTIAAAVIIFSETYNGLTGFCLFDILLLFIESILPFMAVLAYPPTLAGLIYVIAVAIANKVCDI